MDFDDDYFGNKLPAGDTTMMNLEQSFFGPQIRPKHNKNNRDFVYVGVNGLNEEGDEDDAAENLVVGPDTSRLLDITACSGITDVSYPVGQENILDADMTALEKSCLTPNGQGGEEEIVAESTVRDGADDSEPSVLLEKTAKVKEFLHPYRGFVVRVGRMLSWEKPYDVAGLVALLSLVLLVFAVSRWKTSSVICLGISAWLTADFFRPLLSTLLGKLGCRDNNCSYDEYCSILAGWSVWIDERFQRIISYRNIAPRSYSMMCAFCLLLFIIIDRKFGSTIVVLYVIVIILLIPGIRRYGVLAIIRSVFLFFRQSVVK